MIREWLTRLVRSLPSYPWQGTVRAWGRYLLQARATLLQGSKVLPPATERLWEASQERLLPSLKALKSGRALSLAMPWFWARVRVHAWAYLAFALLQVGTSALFLTNTASGTQSAWTGVPLDDTWIHFVYARNLAERFAIFEYNEGVREAGMTSPLWVIVLGIAFKLLFPLGVGPVAISKLLGILLSIGVSILLSIGVSMLLYHLAQQLTGRGSIGVLAGAALALEPTFGFHKVSGMEGPLFSFLVALSLLFFLQGRRLALGISLGLTIWARPEGYLLVGIIGAILVLRRLWERNELELLTMQDVRELGPTLIPPAIFGLTWALYCYSVNGTPFPNTYLAKHATDLGLLNLENLYAIWVGYLRQIPLFSGYASMITFALVLVGSLVCLRRDTLRALPLVLFPWALIYGLSISTRFGAVPWNFWTRRYADPSFLFFSSS